MILQERTNPQNLQTLLICKKEIDNSKIKLLLKLNLLSRLFTSIKSDLSKLEILNKVLPNLKIKVSEFNNNNTNFYLANLNKPNNDNSNSMLPDNMEKQFSDLGVDLPSKDILIDRLDSFSETDIIDPFRLNNINLIDNYSISLSGVDQDLLENAEDLFTENFYSDNYNDKLYYDKVKYTTILAFNEVITNDKTLKIDDSVIDSVLGEVKDSKVRAEIKKEVKEFIFNPQSRPNTLRLANQHINNTKVKSTSGKPIATWKIVTGVTVVIMSLLAYKNSDSIKAAYKVAKNTKDFKGSQFKRFIKSLFTSKGRKNSLVWMNADESELKYKDEIAYNPVRMKKAEYEVKKSGYEKNIVKKFFN
jgi:hypothetical protein